MKFLIVEPSPLPILIPLGPKYSNQDPVLNTLSLHSSLNVRDHVSQTSPIYLISILILSSQLGLGIPRYIFSVSFPRIYSKLGAMAQKCTAGITST